MTRPDDLPSASDWEQAVTRIFNTYPPDVFPPDSDSPDAKAGTWARKVCLNIITEAWRFRTERAERANHERWYGPENLAERHQRHYQTCNCLGDSAVCCDPTCPCDDEPMTPEQQAWVRGQRVQQIDGSSEGAET